MPRKSLLIKKMLRKKMSGKKDSRKSPPEEKTSIETMVATHSRLSMLGLPTEIRLKIYQYAFSDSIVHFSPRYERWWRTGAELLLACKSIHEECIATFWKEVAFSLPDCELSSWRWTLRMPQGCQMVSSIAQALRSQIRHLRVSHFDSLGCRFNHICQEMEMFSNVRLLTVRHDTNYPPNVPTDLPGILDRVRPWTSKAMRHRFRLPLWVQLQFETLIYGADLSGMKIMTDKDCNSILKRADRYFDRETEEWVDTRIWTSSELQHWKDKDEERASNLRNFEILPKLDLPELPFESGVP